MPNAPPFIARVGVPRCPNHGEPLMLTSEELKQTKGSSPCPVSKSLFSWVQDVQTAEVKKDKYGRLQQSYKITGGSE